MRTAGSVPDVARTASEASYSSFTTVACISRSNSSFTGVCDAAAKDTDGYLAAGFILPHDAGIAKGNFLDYICSIDELELQTGIDFFPNLVTRVGTEMANAIEASTPGTFWK